MAVCAALLAISLATVGLAVPTMGAHPSNTHASASPKCIEEGVTDVLGVKCEYKGPGVLLSIGLTKKSKSRDGDSPGQTPQGLAYVVSNNREVCVALPGLGAGQASGEISADGHRGRLVAVWKAPSRDAATEYECQSNVMDGFGKMVTERSKVRVEAQAITSAGLLRLMMGLKSKVSQLSSELASEKAVISRLVDAVKEGKKNIAALQTNAFSSTEYKGHKYYLTEYESLNNLRGQHVCKAMGGYLAEIDDEEEYRFLQKFVGPRMSRHTHIVIGGTDAGHEGTWVFDRTNKRVPFLDWATGEPNNHNPGEHCLAFIPVGASSARMNDLWCNWGPGTFDGRFGFMCEVE